jgi:hypothetical protein
VNATALIVFRLRSLAEQEAIVEENSAVSDKNNHEHDTEQYITVTVL